MSSNTNSLREHGKHGWFTARPHSYAPLLHHQAVKDWIDSYRSSDTRESMLRCLERVLSFAKLSPEELLSLDEKDAKRIVLRYAQAKVQEGKAALAKKTIVFMRSFFLANDKEIKFKRNERIVAPKKRIAEEIIPSKYDVQRIADHAETKRDKAVILCLFQSGVRVGCLSNWNYGLVKDYLEDELKIPVYLKITNKLDTKLSGYNLPYYYTFLNKTAGLALKAYIEERKADGWQPKPDDPVFVTWGTVSRNKRLGEKAIRERLKYVSEKAGLNPAGIWPHVLRKAFRKILNNAAIDEDTKEALMGHKLPGSRGAYFDYHDVDETAKKYMECPFEGDMVGRMNGLEKTMMESDKRVKDLELKVAEYEKAQTVKKPADELMNRLISDPSVQKFLSKKIKELGLT